MPHAEHVISCRLWVKMFVTKDTSLCVSCYEPVHFHVLAFIPINLFVTLKYWKCIENTCMCGKYFLHWLIFISTDSKARTKFFTLELPIKVSIFPSIVWILCWNSAILASCTFFKKSIRNCAILEPLMSRVICPFLCVIYVNPVKKNQGPFPLWNLI